MGVDPLSLAIMLGTGVSAGASIGGGLAARDAAKAEASALEAQSAIASQEATREAERTADDARRFRATQKLAYLKSGVSLAGSPLLVLEETRRLGQEEVDSVLRKGAAQSSLLNTQATQTRNKGRMALLQGVTSAGSSLMSGAMGVKAK